jgi:PAS domain S-box-containing protein
VGKKSAINMDIKTEIPTRSILFVWIIVILVTTSVVSAVITAFLVYYRSTDIMEATDARLLMAAEMSREILGPDYHDQIDGPSSVSEMQFIRIVELNDDLCRRLGLQYLWSVLQVGNNKLVFTSATHSDINDPESTCASFFETHRDPQAFTPALKPELKPSFSSFHNEWGAGRMVLIPRKDSRGRTYIFGASIQLAEYEAIIPQSLLAALTIWFGVLCIAFPAVFALSRRLTSPITGLTDAADRMASGDLDTALRPAGVRELQSLSDSLDRMRRELKQQTETLQKSETRYRSLLSRLPIGVYRNTVGRPGRLLMANEAISKMFGYETPEQFMQSNVSDLYVDPDEMESYSEQLLAQGNVNAVMLRLKKKDGSPFWASVTARAVYDDQGKTKYFDGIIEDITDRKRAEEALRVSEEKYRSLVETTSDWIWEVDNKCTYTYCSPKVKDLLGYKPEELIGKTPFDLMPSEEAMHVSDIFQRAILLQTAFDSIENINLHKNGSHVVMETSGVPIFSVKGQFSGYRGIDRDITERKSLENKLRQAQKIESIGNLAGGVAHDFNNMLSIILGNMELIMEDIDMANPIFANMQEVQKAAQRSADLTRQLLAFARKQTIVPKFLDINETIEGILRMLRRLIGEDIDLVWLPKVDLWTVKVDPSQVDQVLTNLCVNARDSIEGVGKVTIETDNTNLDKFYCRDHLGFVSGDYVMISVSDNGFGMDKETLNNIFEPFFTTKGFGEGTGLGLSTVYGIVKQNNGFINVYSELGKGTTVKIYFPRHIEKVPQPHMQGLEEPAVIGEETILLVEDEKAILRITTKMLESLGYAVLAASSPTEAIRVSESHPGKIDLLMTDVVMPEMSGTELAKSMLHLYPNLRCLFMSGYTANVIARHQVPNGGVYFLNKPFSKQDLATKVREAFDDAESQSHQWLSSV